MRSFSVRPARLILVPSALQSHALLPFRLTSSPSAPPVTRPCAFPSHIILVNPSSHTPLCHSVPHHPRQPSSHIPFYLFISFNISSHLCVFSPLVLDPRGKCRVFPAKTVHFPPWLAWVPAPQATLVALGISTPGESAGNSCENGSLSPMA